MSSTVRVGTPTTVEVVDGGPLPNDGVDVSNSGSLNDWLEVNVPEEGTLPYRIITEGGSSGLNDDLTDVTATAAIGTPLDAELASANASQVVTLTGQGFVENESFCRSEYPRHR